MFICDHCHARLDSEPIGTLHRNHCPMCLWSKHLDTSPGDRKSDCNGLMQPLGLTLKDLRVDKYTKEEKGELALVHLCTECGKVSINRIAGDDNEHQLLYLLENPPTITEANKARLENTPLLTIDQKEEVMTQLFGKNYSK